MNDEATPASPMLDACNPIPADLTDWCDAPFPVSIPPSSPHGGGTILLAAMGERESRQVIGGRFYGGTPENSWTVSALTWAGNGAYAGSERGAYPDMDLPPPPATVRDEVARLEREADTIAQRLADYPDAPAVWREADERAHEGLLRKIAKLTGTPA